MRILFSVFWRSARPYRHLLWMVIPSSLLLSGLWVLEPVYARYAIDQIIQVKDGLQVNIFKLLGGWFLIFLCINLVQGITFYLRWKLQEVLLIETREHYYKRILELDIAHHVKSRGGELMKKIDNAADSVVDMSRQILMELPISILTSIVFYGISFYMSWQLALVSLGLLPIYIVLLSLSVWWTRKHAERVNEFYVRAVGRGYDAIQNIFTVKSGAAENRELMQMENMHGEALKAALKANKVWAILEGIGYFMLMRILLISVGIYLFIQDQITLGTLFFFQFSFFRMVVPLEMLGGMMPRWNDRLEKIRMAEALYKEPVNIGNKPNAHKIRNLQGALKFNNVSFAYGDEDTVSGINLEIRPGEQIAFVGHSGAGKSTLALLLNRFYDVTDGAILIDGTDLRDLDVHWWRNQIGLVLQENIMFNDTVLENIRYARPNATLEEVKEAAKRASAHEFIENLPQKYDTMIGERGIRLSGGERQRVAIARAILKKPSIVVLDEATSALDSITERTVQEGIRELIKGRTSFIIAHRLSTVRSVDRIAVLENGKLTACAPHEELLKISPTYKQMVELQHEGLLAE